MNTPRVPPRFVPTLTEVVEFEEAQVLDEAALAPPELAQGYTPPAEQFVQAANAPVHALADWQQPVPDLALDAAADQLRLQQQLPQQLQAQLQEHPSGHSQEQWAAPEPDFQSVATLLESPTELLAPEPAAVSTEDVPAFLLATQPVPVMPQADAITAAPLVEPVPAPLPVADTAPVAQLDAEREEQIVQNVLLELQRRADLMLEYRLRESLTPILARLCDTLIKEARQDLAATLRDVVARAVAQELTRHRPK